MRNRMCKRILASAAAAVLMALPLTACNGGGSGLHLTLLNSKGEIQEGLEAAADLYREKTGVEIEILVAPAGTSPAERFSQLYNAGTPPTMSMLDTTDVVSIGWDKAVDLSDEKWVDDAGTYAYPIDGKVYSFPLGVEGRGLIYNKTAIEKIIGKTFDPAAYNTYDKFKALLDELKAGGMKAPIVLSNEDWSLGSHYFGMLYVTQSENAEENDAYIDKLTNGQVDIAADPRYTQLMDTFDLLMANNISAAAPLDSQYEVDASYIVDGEVAFWFNGNWAWPNMDTFLTEDNTDEFGMMPLPLGNDENDFVNNNLLGTASKQIMIDKTKATAEEQQAAKDFLNWLVYDKEGQQAMVETLQLVPAFTNITLAPSDPLGRSLKSYIDEGKTGIDVIVPSDHWSIVGEAMQKYLGGQSSRDELADAVEAYWKSKA